MKLRRVDTPRSSWAAPASQLNLRWRISMWLVTGLIVTLVIIGVGVGAFVYRTENSAWQGRQGEAVHSAAVLVANVIERAHNTLADAGAMDVTEPTIDKNEFDGLFQRDLSLEEMVYFDAAGHVIASVSRQRSVLGSMFTASLSTWFQAARRGRTYIGEVEIDPDNVPYLIMALPAQAGSVIAARVRMEVFNTTVANLRFGIAGQAYVIDQQGNIAAHSDMDVVLARSTIAGRPEYTAILQAPDQTWRGEHEDFQGRRVASASARVPGTDWIVITSLPLTEAYAATSQATLLLGIGLIIIGLLLFAAISQRIERLVIKPIKALRSGAQRFGQGDLDYRVSLTRHDEIGQVAVAFNDMAARLQDRETQLRCLNAELEERVAQRTAELQQTNAASVAANARLKHLLSVSSTVIYTFGVAGRAGPTFVSDNVERQLGYLPHELVDDPNFFVALIQPDDAARFFEKEAELIRFGAHTFEFRLRHRDGAYRWMRIDLRLICDAAGQPVEIVGSAIDITDRKQVDEALRLSEARLRQIIDLVPYFIFAKDIDGKYLLVNQALADAYGTTVGELLQHTDTDFARYAEEALHFRADDLAVIHNGQPKVVPEEPLTDARGQVRLFNTTKIPFTFSGSAVSAILGVSVDITERKRAEDALRDSEAFYQSLVEVLPQSLCRKNLAGRFTFANRRFLEESNCSLADLIGKDDYDLHPPDQAEKYRADDRRVIESGQSFETVEPRAVIGGSPTYVQTLKAPIYAGSGEVIGIQIMFWDVTDRKRAEEALRLSEARLRQIIDLVPHFIFAKDIDGKFLLVNRAVAEAYGTTVDDLLLHTDADFAQSAEEVQHFRDDDLAVIHGGAPKVVPEEQITDSRGQIRWLQTTKIPFTFSDSAMPAVLGVSVDITEIKRAGQALHDSEERYRLLAELSPDAICISDLQARIVWCNAQQAALFGFNDPADVIGLGIPELIAPEDQRLIQASMRAVGQSSGGGKGFEFTGLRRDGRRIIVEARGSVMRAADNTTVAIIAVLRDITERKHVEEQLRLQAAALQAAANAIVITDRLGIIQWINPAFTRLTGYGGDEVIGQNPRVLQSGQHNREFYMKLWSTILAGRAWHGELINKRKDGSFYAEEMTITPVTDAAGAVVRFIAIKQDITERKQAEELLRDSRERYRLLYIAERRQAQELTLLDQARTALMREIDLPVVMRTIIDAITANFGYRHISLYFRQDGHLALQHQIGYEHPITEIPINRGITGRVARTGLPVLVPNVRNDPDFLAATEDVVSEICTPLFDRGQVVGVLNVESIGQSSLDEGDLHLVTALSEHISIAIEHARLYEQAQQELAERKRTEAELRRLKEFNESIVQTMTEGVIIQDEQGDFEYANPAAVTMLGYTLEELLGNHGTTIVPIDQQPIVEAANVRRARGETDQYELAVCRKDGARVSLLVSATPWFEEGRFAGSLSTFADITALIRIEAELRRLKEFNESIVQTMTEGVIIQNPAGYLTYANPAAASILKYAVKDLAGRYWTTMIPVDQWPVIEAAAGRRVQGTADRYELEAVRSDGARITVMVSGSPWFEDGRFAGSLVAFSDITERKQAEQTLARHARTMEALYQTSLEINAQPDLHTLLRAIVERAADILGATMGSLYLMEPDGETLKLVVNHNISSTYLGLTLRPGDGVAGRVAVSGQYLEVGDYLTWEGRAGVFTHPEFSRVLGMPLKVRGRVLGVIDIMDLKSEPFSKSDIRLVSLFADQAAIAVEKARLFESVQRQVGEQGALLAASRAISSSLNLQSVLKSLAEQVGRVVNATSGYIGVCDLVAGTFTIMAEYFGPDAADKERASDLNVTYDIRQDFGSVFEYHTVNGLQRQYHVADADLPDVEREHLAVHGGNSAVNIPLIVKEAVIGFIEIWDSRGYRTFTGEEIALCEGIAQQAAIAIENARLHEQVRQHAAELEGRVFERTRDLTAAYEQLSAINARLTELDKLKDQFMSRINHELRTPLTTIKIYLELIATGKPEKREKYLQAIQTAADRLHRLIEDLLIYNELTRVISEAQLAPFNLNLVVAANVNYQWAAAEARGLTLLTDLQPDLPAACGESTLLGEVLTRVLKNAIQYTPAGSVTVVTGQQLRADRAWLTITVRDTGPGISANDLPHVFERFYRGAASNDYKTPGTGLGLSIAQDIAHALEGDITAQSETGRGAVFTIWLKPAAPG